MGRIADAGVTKTIVAHVRGQPLHAAWVDNGKPGSWKNVLRRAKAAVAANAAKAAGDAAQQQQAAPQTAPRGKKAAAGGSSRGAAASKKTAHPLPLQRGRGWLGRWRDRVGAR
jgi:hypothetical protein